MSCAVWTAGVMITYGQHVANKTPDSVSSARPVPRSLEGRWQLSFVPFRRASLNDV